MPPSLPPPPLIDDLIHEIFLRLPPDEPEHLFRAALVCKTWLRILCDPGFLRRYRTFHGTPPLLGLLHRLQVLEGRPARRFASTTSVPDFPHPSSGDPWERALDCRHGRVLIYMRTDENADYLVWDPVTGERHGVPSPDIDWLIESAVVLCAADGCDHLDCHGGPFRVVFAATHDYKDTIFASVYSSETGVWSVPVCLDKSCEVFAQHMREGLADRPYYTPYLQPRRGTLVGDAVYFTVRWGNPIVKYDLGKNCLSMIDPPAEDVYYVSLMVTENSSLGFTCTRDSSLYMWSRKVDTEEAADWVQCRVIELEKTIPVANPDDKPVVVGFAEGVGVIFISTCVGLFMIKLKSGLVRNVGEAGVYFSVLPYMSFYTPDRGRMLSLARTN
ncbi:hypothetical protein CFC21_056942 [Triticum aestivum]|uniref:F-box domain-containing protein n=3 Tax=Triticum TaxID=4564 RepID=A0A9R0SXC6_TRITD|nr:uncharacterized protein LOC123091324 [Triticum aestivum]KAF7048130.1 hypothetical protein CFC21_056942 [Triticum aestivum]VAI03205.1 unnamed protein product [Triticum turgidum subsp. durum]